VGLNFVVALLSMFHLLFNESDPTALFVAAGLFAVPAFLVRRMSRVAALSALVLYVLNYLLTVSHSSQTGNFFFALILTMGLVTGVRGTFAYHRFKKQKSSAQITLEGQ
jgi:hypothetical protein